jgi:hypothetical protein
MASILSVIRGPRTHPGAAHLSHPEPSPAERPTLPSRQQENWSLIALKRGSLVANCNWRHRRRQLLLRLGGSFGVGRGAGRLAYRRPPEGLGQV